MYEEWARKRMLATQNNDAARAAVAQMPQLLNPSVQGKSRDQAGAAMQVSGRYVGARSSVEPRSVTTRFRHSHHDTLSIEQAGCGRNSL